MSLWENKGARKPADLAIHGLAVKSSVGRLLASLSQNGPGEFRVAAVQYVERSCSLLVERLFVSPYAEPWILPVVRDAVSRYQFDFEVLQSRLNTLE